MTHLIPEQRVNKNGVPVIKHVLPPAAGTAGKSSLPAVQPISTPRNDWSELEPLVYEQIEHETDDPDSVIKRIRNLEPDFRTQVTDALLSGDEYSAYTALTLMEGHDDVKAQYIMATLSFHRAITLEHLETTSDRSLTMRASVKGLMGRFTYEHFGRPEGEITDERVTYFKTDIVADQFNFRNKYKVNFERYVALGDLADEIDLVEKALPAIVQTNSAIRHWRQENRQSTDAGALGADDMLAIARVVSERPDSAGLFYQYARARGFFNAEGFIAMIDTDSPSLYDGVL